MPASIPFKELDKGSRIEIVGGKHKGHFGWEHLTANTCAQKEWVILEANGTNHPEEKTHCINKENVARVPEANDEPRSYEEALLEEHIDVKQDMLRLAKKLAAFVNRAPREQMILDLFIKMWRGEKRKNENFSVVPYARAVTSWHSNQRGESMNETDETSRAVVLALAESDVKLKNGQRKLKRGLVKLKRGRQLPRLGRVRPFPCYKLWRPDKQKLERLLKIKHIEHILRYKKQNVEWLLLSVRRKKRWLKLKRKMSL